LAGLLGLGNGETRDEPAGAESRVALHEPARKSPPPWRDAGLTLEQRLHLSDGASLEQRLCSAMAQLECGQCGSSCQEYATSLASGAERDPTLCAPGGRATARALRVLLAEPAGVNRSALGETTRRSLRAPSDAHSALPFERKKPIADGQAEAQRLRVKAQRKLTLADAGSEIREVVLEPSSGRLDYRTGDSLAVLPHNDPDLVRALLRSIGARGQELVSTAAGPCEVWRCLLEDVDITHLRPETLELLSREAAESRDAKALAELRERGVPSGFDLLDLLVMFPSARPAVDRLVATLGPLEPRLYAIASAPSVHPDEIHLVVRMVRSERGGRERKGVASHFLGEGLFRGDDVGAYVRSSDPLVLPDDWSGPMIMLGSGTGVARYRAFLQELQARGRRGGTWLILASCFEGDEALYEAELEAWSRLGVLEHLDVIKLGQRGRRIGPQDILRKRARRVLSWLDRGAIVYACGEGKALWSSLDETLIECLARHGKMTPTEASDFVHVLRREGRYVEELY
jgi:sulfite reductase (NADPH) flavoprotein alpha-component